MDFIKSLQLQKQEEHTLSMYLKEHLEGYSKARSVHHIHASDITKDNPEFCAREIVLMRIFSKARKDQFLGQATKVAFEIGEAYHDLVRDKWLRNIAVGHWTCPHCSHQIDFSKLPKIDCPQCGSNKWAYTEVRFMSEEFGVSGSIDFIADLQLQKSVITEIKSMDKDQFSDLVAPIAEHRLRTSLYLKIIESSDSPYKDRLDLQHARIIYVSKGYGKKTELGKFSPFKEYVITRNDAAIETYVGKAKAIKLFEDKGVLPSGVCKTAFDPRCKSCLAAPDCFGQFYPPGAIFKK
jgi:rubrerythrin